MPFISLDTWTLIFTWVNLCILFFVVKKLFLKKLQGILDERNEEISASYRAADDKKAEADALKESYETKLSKAHEEADEIISVAVSNASLRSDSIVREAEERAEGIISRAEKNIEAEKEAAYSELKGDVSSMAVDIAKKIIEKDLDEKEHERLISEALESIGGKNG